VRELHPRRSSPIRCRLWPGHNFSTHRGDPAALNRSLTTEILGLDRSVIPQQTMKMDDILDIGQYARPRFGLVLFSVFAASDWCW